MEILKKNGKIHIVKYRRHGVWYVGAKPAGTKGLAGLQLERLLAEDEKESVTQIEEQLKAK